jgi:ribosomal protein L7Ae-like RNA K-turn-binding protein
MQPKPLRLLGLARRAGKLVCGSDAVKEASVRAKLILIAGDAGNTVKREANRYGKQVIELPFGKEELGSAVGRSECAVAAVIDKEFTRGIIKALGEERSEG